MREGRWGRMTARKKLVNSDETFTISFSFITVCVYERVYKIKKISKHVYTNTTERTTYLRVRRFYMYWLEDCVCGLGRRSCINFEGLVFAVNN